MKCMYQTPKLNDCSSNKPEAPDNRFRDITIEVFTSVITMAATSVDTLTF